MEIVALALSMVSVFLIVMGFMYVRTPSRLRERVSSYGGAAAVVGEAGATQNYYQRRLRPYAQRLGRRFRRLKRYLQPGDWDQKLVWGNYPGGIRNSDELLGLALLITVPLVLMLALSTSGGTRIGMTALSLFLGLAMPPIWVDSRASERQRKVNQSVPDALDILTICVQAGLGFDGALAQIVQHTEGPLTEEFSKFLRELDVGVPREECFNRLLQRTNADELRILVGALVQAQKLGVPIGQTLEEQAGDMRVRRIQRAREEGSKASPKIALITTILVAPAVMCLFLSIVIYSMVGQFSQLFG